MTKQKNHIDFSIIPFKNEFIERNFEDRPGDTVMVIMPTCKIRAAIKEISSWGSDLVGGISCLLSPIDSLPPNAMDIAGMNEYAVLRRGSGITGNVFSFDENVMADSSLIPLMDSIKIIIQKAYYTDITIPQIEYWKDQAKFDKYVGTLVTDTCAPNITSYLKSDSLLPEIAFINCGCKKYLYEGFYIAQKVNGRWNIIVSKPPKKWGPFFRIGCAFDLDSDGEYEYLVNESDGDLSRPAIYSLKNGEWKALYAGEWQGEH